MKPEDFERLDTVDDKLRVIYQEVYSYRFHPEKCAPRFRKIWIAIAIIGVLTLAGVGLLNEKAAAALLRIVPMIAGV